MLKIAVIRVFCYNHRMKIIISPAKKMNEDQRSIEPEGNPLYLKETREILKWIQGLSYDECRELWAANEKITDANFARFRDMDLVRRLTPAILSYEGIQYQYMAPNCFETEDFGYVEEHLRILSGFYGVLRPLDGVTPYRLEMQAKGAPGKARDLYEFWGDKLYKGVIDDSRIIINLASKEYSKAVEKYLEPGDRFITCTFAEDMGVRDKQGRPKLVTKGVYAKMARGEMVRYMAVNRVEDPEDLKNFCAGTYVYREELSDEGNYVFTGRPE